MTVKSDPVVVLEGIARGAINQGPGHLRNFRLSPLVYVPGPASPDQRTSYLAAIDRAGKVEMINAPPDAYHFPRVSPDGQHIAVGIEDGKDANLWTYDLTGATAMRKLTFGGRNRFPVWSLTVSTTRFNPIARAMRRSSDNVPIPAAMRSGSRSLSRAHNTCRNPGREAASSRSAFNRAHDFLCRRCLGR